MDDQSQSTQSKETPSLAFKTLDRSINTTSSTLLLLHKKGYIKELPFSNSPSFFVLNVWVLRNNESGNSRMDFLYLCNLSQLIDEIHF